MTIESNETPIRALLHARASAIHAKNAGAALAPYAPGIVKFDLAPPLATIGPRALDLPNIEDWFATWRGPIGYDLYDLRITVSHDLAFCTGFVRISGTKTDGASNDIWVRQTTCLSLIDGMWRIVHEHSSVPFYMDGSFKAAIDLKP
jgi:ketosteroid isomerase-like protein